SYTGQFLAPILAGRGHLPASVVPETVELSTKASPRRTTKANGATPVNGSASATKVKATNGVRANGARVNGTSARSGVSTAVLEPGDVSEVDVKAAKAAAAKARRAAAKLR